ncbi:YceI family protein [Spirosoma sp. HMF4905]|uniref:YceI family protein n=1 Tax=Spirosoma arboris TaxID=2682092 RepID=A0A7K1SBJ2_9BACT|nr:YceI family protein [Spirosoma arboris]MVM31141.1 YceI family protein [Spirosoma arboris]
MKKTVLVGTLAIAALVWNCKENEGVMATTYVLDDTKSVAEWKGYLRTGYFNEGSIQIKSNNLTVQDGKVTGGTFSIPLSSIKNFNLPIDSLKQLLIHHLQSEDFFNMALYPDLSYTITSVAPYDGTVGIAGANYQVNGNLTMLGKTNPVSFPARINLSNNDFTAEGTLKVNRTLWGITYASDPALPDASFIKPDIDIHLKLVGSHL